MRGEGEDGGAGAGEAYAEEAGVGAGSQGGEDLGEAGDLRRVSASFMGSSQPEKALAPVVRRLRRSRSS